MLIVVMNNVVGCRLQDDQLMQNVVVDPPS
jgi:hypothetical protein